MGELRMLFHQISPPCVGSRGDRSVFDATTDTPTLKRLHMVMGDWQGDELLELESEKAFLVSQHLADGFKLAGLTGYRLSNVEISGTASSSGQKLPRFRWLRITGQGGVDDFGLTDWRSLLVSARALEVLKTGNVDSCDIRPGYEVYED